MTTVSYKNGLITLDPASEDLLSRLPWFTRDPRTLLPSAPAHRYADTIRVLLADKISHSDSARAYEKHPFSLQHPLTPRRHQSEALDAWIKAGGRGVVQIPTGGGKTILALLAIARMGRPTMVVVPTIDLMRQWEEQILKFLGGNVGMIGGGSHTLAPISVATYDSAAIHAEKLGNQFGLLVFDECHHLPAPLYQSIALGSVAPFRLGLSATVERSDGRERDIFEMIGPLVYTGDIHAMVNRDLAPYEVISVEVPMTTEERQQYDAARKTYKDFLKSAGIHFQSGADWMDFVKASARSAAGREAMKAYRLQKTLAQASRAKIDALWTILQRHHGERVIVFTDDNAMAYRVGRSMMLSVLTHHTRVKERKRLLDDFRAGAIDVLVSSRVLNEGVDVPEASIGVVLSGSGTVREHVQRLGRILRHQPGKQATLYEIVSRDTSEVYVNQRRRQHHAYQGPS